MTSATFQATEIQAVGGFQEVTLLPADLVYDWLCEDNLRLAKVMGKTGAASETWCGVAERAEQLGYPVGEVSRKRSQLGKWVARGGLLKKQEARLCNGTQRSVNLYLVDDELDSRINSFFEKA